MNTYDTILTKMITNDLIAKGITDYQLLNEVVTNPTTIKVGANEVVYVMYCYVNTATVFSIKLNSGTAVATYNELNTRQHTTGTLNTYESSLITAHWSNINIQSNLNTGHFFIQYVRVAFSKQAMPEIIKKEHSR